MKIAIFTSIIGSIDQLWSVWPLENEAEHFAFVDSPRREVGIWDKQGIIRGSSTFRAQSRWELRIIEPQWDARRTARHYKILAHRYMPEFDVWIWVDGTARLMIPAQKAVRDWLKGDIAVLKNPYRNCLYDEANYCIKQNRDDPQTLRRQIAHYQKQGMPAKFGLPETRILIRRNTEQIREFNERWWKEVETRSLRDQVSFPFVCWQLGLKWNTIPGKCTPGKVKGPFAFINHRRK